MRTPVGISIGKCQLGAYQILSQMDKHERSFIVRIEQFMSQVAAPEYRQIIVELLMIIHLILERNPEFVFSFNEYVDLDKVIIFLLLHYLTLY